LSERDNDPTNSDQGGHDDCQPKCRDSASDFGASIWTTEEWRLFLTSGDLSDSDETSTDDGRPRTHTKPSKSKTKWSATKANAQIKSSLKLLRGWKKEAPFRALKLPDSIDWLEPELMKGKTLEDSELWANTAGTCGLSALTCLETSHTHAGQIHAVCKSLPPLADASKEDVAALKAWRDDIRAEVDKWLAHVQVRSDVGAKLSAALLNKETDLICQELAKTPSTHAGSFHPSSQFPHPDAPLLGQRQGHQSHGSR
jgi:hypothetical protein